MINFSDMENAQEAVNVSACRAAFKESHPDESIKDADLCDAGSWSCKNCPWAKTAHLHSANIGDTA